MKLKVIRSSVNTECMPWNLSRTSEFADGPMQPIFEMDDRQFVIDDDGNRVYGVWYIPPDECAMPIIVESNRDRLAEDF